MFNAIKRHLFPERINGKKVLTGGLIKEKDDPRNFKMGWMWGAYAPLHRKYEIETVCIKDQKYFNTCVFNSVTAQKEKDERCELSVASVVCKAKELGLVSGNGFSTLSNGQKVIKNFGASSVKTSAEESENWDNYSHPGNLSQEVKVSADKHRSQSYWQISGRSETLRALDEDRIIHTGMNWFSGFNMSGGFGPPWIIKENKGYEVGGHAIIIIGYSLDNNTYTIQNSYGTDWGDHGKFYIDMDFFDRTGHARYIQQDIPQDIAPLLMEVEGQAVKVKGKPEIYFIREGKKCPFASMLVFFSFGFGPKGYRYITDEECGLIPNGDTVDFKDSQFWEALSTVSDLTNATLIINAIEKL